MGVAELLVRYGATRSSMALNPMQTLIAACLRDDKAAIRDEIARHPEFLKSHEALFAATRYNRREAVELLLDLGTSPNVESPEGERALHIAAYDDAVDVGELSDRARRRRRSDRPPVRQHAARRRDALPIHSHDRPARPAQPQRVGSRLLRPRRSVARALGRKTRTCPRLRRRDAPHVSAARR